MKGCDIVMMSLQNWGDDLGSNSYNITMELAKHNRVLYINRAPDRINQIKNMFTNKVNISKFNSISNPINNIFILHTKTVLESINWLPSIPFSYFNYLNGKKIAKEINNTIEILNMKNVILFIDNDFFRGLYLKELIKPSKFIYYIRDNLRTHKYFKKHGKKCEEEIAGKADIIVANSKYLSELLKPINSNCHDIGQGCDTSILKNEVVEKPYDMPDNNLPNIGYVGNIIGYRLDLKMLENICAKRNNWNWIFIGPEDKYFRDSKLHKMSNVYFIGIKKQHEIWKYIKYLDVCINPQIKNGMTVGNYPRKIDEYLYMGKPVVATRTDFMESFSSLVYLYNDFNEFEEKIICALSENNDSAIQEKRILFTKNNTWEHCVNKINKHLSNERF